MKGRTSDLTSSSAEDAEGSAWPWLSWAAADGAVRASDEEAASGRMEGKVEEVDETKGY